MIFPFSALVVSDYGTCVCTFVFFYATSVAARDEARLCMIHVETSGGIGGAGKATRETE